MVEPQAATTRQRATRPPVAPALSRESWNDVVFLGRAPSNPAASPVGPPLDPAASEAPGRTVELPSSGPPVATQTGPAAAAGTGNDLLQQTRCLSFPTSVGRLGAEVHLFDGLISQNSHEVLLLRPGYYGLRLKNQNEAAWDSLYLGMGKMRLVGQYDVVDCPPDCPLLSTHYPSPPQSQQLLQQPETSFLEESGSIPATPVIGHTPLSGAAAAVAAATAPVPGSSKESGTRRPPSQRRSWGEAGDDAPNGGGYDGVLPLRRASLDRRNLCVCRSSSSSSSCSSHPQFEPKGSLRGRRHSRSVRSFPSRSSAPAVGSSSGDYSSDGNEGDHDDSGAKAGGGGCYDNRSCSGKNKANLRRIASTENVVDIELSDASDLREVICRAQQEKVNYFYLCQAMKLMRLKVFASLSLGMRVKGSYDLLYCGDRKERPRSSLRPFTRKVAMLCLDGGGVLGISSLKILERVELELQRKLQNPNIRLMNCFDFVAGTSTGGIIALGLLAGMSIKEMINMWANMSSRIFEGNRTLFSGIFFEGYDVVKLKNALAQSLGQRFLNTYKGPYCFVTATDVKTNPYQLFLLRNYVHSHLAHHEFRGATALPLWTAAWATAAAPTFLRGPTASELEVMGLSIQPEVQLCDGAMKANNPTLVALEEAARLTGKKLRHFIETDLDCLISVGTGQPTLKPTIEAKSGPVSTFQILLNSTHLLTSATSVHRDVLHWMGDHEGIYYRFNVPGIGDIPLDAIDKSSFDIILKATNDYMSDEKYYDIRRLVNQLARRVTRR